MADSNEVVFETEICAYLEAHGWLYSANDSRCEGARRAAIAAALNEFVGVTSNG